MGFNPFFQFPFSEVDAESPEFEIVEKRRRIKYQLLTMFLQCSALDVTASCINEIHCLALDGFDLNIVHNTFSFTVPKEKKS